MNFLAHTYLTPRLNDILIGNIMADAVKGKQYLAYPKSVQQGILLHRSIDSFTDKHPLTSQFKSFFRPAYGLHTGIVTDILYDHFLAFHWQEYHPESLVDYTGKLFPYLQKKLWLMPARTQYFLPYLMDNNWFLLYQSPEGLERIFKGMVRRGALPDKTKEMLLLLEQNEEKLYTLFHLFFTELCASHKKEA